MISLSLFFILAAVHSVHYLFAMCTQSVLLSLVLFSCCFYPLYALHVYVSQHSPGDVVGEFALFGDIGVRTAGCFIVGQSRCLTIEFRRHELRARGMEKVLETMNS